MTHLAQVLKDALLNTALFEVHARAFNHLVDNRPVDGANSIV